MLCALQTEKSLSPPWQVLRLSSRVRLEAQINGFECVFCASKSSVFTSSH